jgi:hypothetical protein
MKTLLVAVLLVFAVPAHAAVSLFAMVNPSSELRNPVSGGASVEGKGLRLGGTVGSEGAASATLDLIAHQGDLFFGVGVVADRLLGPDYSDITVVLDSTTVSRPHDQGHHYGDKHQHKGRTFTTVRSYSSVLTFDFVDIGLSPSLFMSVSGKQGLFVDARVLFNGDDVSNRMSVGLRW